MLKGIVHTMCQLTELAYRLELRMVKETPPLHRGFSKHKATHTKRMLKSILEENTYMRSKES